MVVTDLKQITKGSILQFQFGGDILLVVGKRVRSINLINLPNSPWVNEYNWNKIRHKNWWRDVKIFEQEIEKQLWKKIGQMPNIKADDLGKLLYV